MGKSLKITDQLLAIYHAGLDDIETVREYVHFIHQSTLPKVEDLLAHALTDDERRQFSTLIDAISVALSKLDDRTGVHKITVEMDGPVSEKVVEVAMALAIKPMRRTTIIAQMSLVHLVARLEGTLKDYLNELLCSNPFLLKSSSSITAEEVIECESLSSIYALIASKDLNSLDYSGIEETAKYFSKRFNIVLSDFPEWHELRENFERRNLLAHNSGKQDDKYRRKLKERPELCELELALGYVDAAAERIKKFLIFVHGCIEGKGKESKGQ